MVDWGGTKPKYSKARMKATEAEMSEALENFNSAYKESTEMKLQDAKRILRDTQEMLAHRDRTEEANATINEARVKLNAAGGTKDAAQEAAISALRNRGTSMVVNTYPDLDDPQSLLSAKRRIKILLEQSNCPLSEAQELALMTPDERKAYLARKRAQETQVVHRPTIGDYGDVRY